MRLYYKRPVSPDTWPGTEAQGASRRMGCRVRRRRRRPRMPSAWLFARPCLVRLVPGLIVRLRGRLQPEFRLCGRLVSRLRARARSQLEPLEELVALQQPQCLAQEPAHLLGGAHRAHRRRWLLLLPQTLHERRQQAVQAVLHRRPGRVVAVEVGLVHGQPQPRDLDLPDQARQARRLGGSGVAEPLAARDQTAEPVAPHARLDARPLRQHSDPTGQSDTAGPNPKVLALHRRQRGGEQALTIERYDAACLFEERAVGLADTLGNALGVHPPVHALDPDPSVPERFVDALCHLSQLIRLEPASISVLAILQPPGHVVAGLADLDGEPRAEIADGRLAALTVLAEEIASTFPRAAPAQVVALDLPRPHALTAGGHDLDPARPEGEVDRQPHLGEARVDHVVDQLEDGIDRVPVVREQRGRDLRREPFADGEARHPGTQFASSVTSSAAGRGHNGRRGPRRVRRWRAPGRGARSAPA